MLLSFITALSFFIFLVWYLASNEEKKRRWLGLAAIISICLNCGLSLYPLQEKIKLGLDLKGGTSYLIQLEGEPTSAALDQATAVIRKRVDKFGLAEPIIQPTGTNRITVQIPGLSEKDKESARQQLSKVAKLDFRLVHPNSSELLANIKSGKEKLPLEYTILSYPYTTKEGEKLAGEIIVKRRPEMSGKNVVRAFRGFDEVGRATVVMEFNDQGKQEFGQITAANVNRQMAIVLDSEVKSAPNINSAIYGGSAIISGGNMNPAEAEELSSVLENPLETPVKILEERGVDPSLGQDSVESGQKAGLLALGLVVTFMIFYYRLAGVVAVIALFVNLLLLMGILAQFHFTLTLPGIAGIVLTIGMAVDANVLVYERIRDELAAGKPLPNAIQGGFERAFSAIFDSNITTIIPAVIVMWLGSGPLQGFAVTLTIGIIVNLLTSLVVTRNGFEWLLSTGKLKKLTMMQLIGKPSFNFLRFRFAATAFSAICLIIGLSVFALRSGELLGVDFAGGDALTLSYQQQVPVSELREVLDKANLRVATLQYASAEKKLLLQTRYNEGALTEKKLQESFPQAQFTHGALESVGPIVGEELKSRALWALTLGLLAILFYVAIRYEWSFAIAAAATQMHDVLITVGVLALLGYEFNMTLIGAFLTILGHSINEKIVIFDRIREGIKVGEKKTLFATINHALNLTLARTLMTGGTVLLAILSLLFAGGSIIHVFALAMLIGVITGIFSSHFITPPLAMWLSALGKKGQKIIVTEPETVAANG